MKSIRTTVGALAAPTSGLIVVALLTAFGGCPQPTDPIPANNTTDPTNGGASYIGSKTCAACHSDIAATQTLTAHANALTPVLDGAPVFPAPSAGVPEPPAGIDWAHVSYLIGGFKQGALFLDADGHIFSTGVDGIATQWNAALPVNGTTGEFVDFDSDATTPVPYAFARFSHETTGAIAFSAAHPLTQENRPGIEGTWAEPGVQCEACHGPGSAHFFTVDGTPQIDRSRIFVDLTGVSTCKACHSEPFGGDGDEILAADGFILPRQQYAELRASGGHRDFSCTTCHDPHLSLSANRDAAIRNDCTACHVSVTKAGHVGKVFRRADGYTEVLSCESCHMPYATRAFSEASESVAGPIGRIGDTRAHVFRIDTDPTTADGQFKDAGTRLRLDAQGRAAISVDFVCLRCHNGGELFTLTTARAAEIAPFVHDFPDD
ncbi:MAG: hypothetical protein KDA32_06435 [Phycisphaerales bacterium]|nr:hypothetical protein [Phycisphaerales bacterium]